MVNLKFTFQSNFQRWPLANEIDDNKVEYDVGENEIGKWSFGTDACKIHFILWIALQSQANWKMKKKN